MTSTNEQQTQSMGFQPGAHPPAQPVPRREVRQAGTATRDSAGQLFPGPDGNAALDYSNWRERIWLPATEAAQLTGLGFHDLRRANATAMVHDHVDVKTAQTRLGHSDPRLTLAVYAQATAEGDREAADKLGARFMTRTGTTLTVVPNGRR